jgi:hypothetical protein
MGGKTDAAETAAGLSTEDANALDLLRSRWGDLYAIDFEPGTVRPWQAERRGVAHRIVTAASAENLDGALTEDYEAAG